MPFQVRREEDKDRVEGLTCQCPGVHPEMLSRYISLILPMNAKNILAKVLLLIQSWWLQWLREIEDCEVEMESNDRHRRIHVIY